MKRVYFTITGMFAYYGNDLLEKDMKVALVKEPDNDYDKEAIKVELEGLGTIGYVANSARTVMGESWSAGRIYDKIGDRYEGTIMYKVHDNGFGYIEIEEACA